MLLKVLGGPDYSENSTEMGWYLIADKLFGLTDNNRDFSSLKNLEDKDFKRVFDEKIEEIDIFGSIDNISDLVSATSIMCINEIKAWMKY